MKLYSILILAITIILIFLKPSYGYKFALTTRLAHKASKLASRTKSKHIITSSNKQLNMISLINNRLPHNYKFRSMLSETLTITNKIIVIDIYKSSKLKLELRLINPSKPTLKMLYRF